LKTASPAQIVWKTELGDVECPIGRCLLLNPDISVASDGSVWVVADLGAMPPNAPWPSVGRAIAHFDAQGTLVSATTISTVTQVSSNGRLLPFRSVVQGMRALSNGHLLIVEISLGENAFELHDYDGDGVLISRRPLVGNASGVAASIDETGELSLLFAYESEPPPSPSYVTRRANVARFDSRGRLLWNQTALANFHMLPTSLIQASATRASDGFFVRFIQAHPEAAGPAIEAGLATGPGAVPESLIFANVDNAGRVAWAREFPDRRQPDNSYTVMHPDGVFIWRADRHPLPEGGEGYLVRIDRLDENGVPAIAAFVPPPHGNDNNMWWAGVDGKGRALIQDFGLVPLLLATLSEDGLTCPVSSLDIDVTDPVTQNSEPARFVSLGPDLFFAARTSIGRVTIPEVQ
jgi:hypothetical protein